MKNRVDSVVARAAVLAAAAAVLSLPAASAHAAASAPPAHSPSGSCVRAAVLAVQDRHMLGSTPRLVDAFSVMLAHRHAACPAFVDYLNQAAA